MNKVLVCPIAFNENVKLESAIRRFINSRVYGRVDYLVIDDASDDGTTEVIGSFKNHGIETIKHPARRGVGSGIRTAAQYAIKNGYAILVIMAGNDKDNPEEIPFLLDPILNEGYDLIQGSRYLGRCGAGGDMPLYRKIAVRLHSAFFSSIVKQKITDSTNGFRAIKVSLLKEERINLFQEWLDRYELEPYLLFKAIRLGYKVKEVPVTKIYPPRKLGYTKMKPLIGWWSILRPLFYLWLGIKK